MSRVAFFLLSLSVCLFVVFPAHSAGSTRGDESRFALAGADPFASARVTRVESRSDGVRMHLEVPGFTVRMTPTKAGPRGVLEIPGAGVVAEVGDPRLPVLRYLVEVPPGATLHLDLSESSPRRLSLRELGISAPLLPVQPSVPKIEGAGEKAPYSEDSAIYATDGMWPEKPVVALDRAVIRGRHVALVEVRPIRYNPVRGEILVWPEAALQVRVEGGVPSAARRAKSRLDSRHFDAWLDGETTLADPGQRDAAPSGPESNAGGASEGAVGMLVVAYDGFVDALEPLLEWKRKTGLKVELVRTSDLGAAPSASDVKAAIQQRYDTWADPALDFVLMVGDTDFCPIHTGSGGGNSQVTDNWFACLDGPDYLPDVAIARISTRTATETSDVVDKLLTYERATFVTDQWVKTVGFIGTSDSGHIGLIEGTHDWCIDNYYTPNDYLATPWSYGYASCDRHYNSYDADTSDISASIDEGRAIVNYSGHGGYYSWEGPTSHGSYDQADVRGNTNDGLYPFVISNACITGTLGNEECFGETWQKVPHGGAIAFWGASNNSYWDEDDVLQRDLHGNIFPMDDTPALGVIVNATKLDLYTHYGDVGNVAYYFDMYNLLSEPSLSLWTRAPRDWVVSYPAAHPIGESSFTVTVSHEGQPIEGALVALRKTDEAVFESGFTDASGVVTLHLDPAPESVGPMEVTATRHDFRPHEGMSEVISPDTPWLVHRSHAVDDSAAGDGDGHVNPGEEFVMSVTVENVGGQPGTGLQGTLTTSTPEWCEVLDAAASFPDLAPDELGTSAPDHYRVRVGETVPDGVVLGFDLQWSASEGATGTTSFGEQVVAVEIDLEGYDIDDAELGNGNGVAGPGETVDMTIDLRNAGHRDATGVSAVLTTDSSHVTILQDQAAFPDIPAQGIRSSDPPPYRFSVSESAPDQEPVTFTLTVTEAGSGYEEVILFDVMISSCAVAPSEDVPKPISDNSTVESKLEYLHAIEIGEVNVFTNISHTYRGDLRVTVVSPSGTSCVLHDRTGSGSDNLVTWYDTETEPAEPLSVFEGENAFGTWDLIVEDLAGGDTGTLNEWMIEICGTKIEPIPSLAAPDHSVDDSAACNPDGVADVGETVILNVTVRNEGWSDATSVQATLSSAAKVAVLNNPISLPDLAPREEGTAAFQVKVGAVGCMELADFRVDLLSAEGAWFDTFQETLEGDVHDTVAEEDVEHDGAEPPGWSHSAESGVDDWRVVDDRNHTSAGAWSWFSSDVDSVKDDRLVSPTYELSGGSWLEFWHWVDMESGYDGGVLEMSEDGGETWADLGPWMTEGGYDRSLSGSNPISGRDAWTGSFSEWRRTVVDLSSFAGASAVFRWRLTTDGSVSRTGWWIDDVVVQRSELVCDAQPCGIPGEVTLRNVTKSGDDVLLEWWSDPVCLDFSVWRSADPTHDSAFSDATAEDPDPTDASFLDTSGGSILYWIIQGHGPDGDGPWGHYGR